MMEGKLAGRCIWITAADTEIGQALAIALSDMGNFVIVTGTNDVVLQRMVFAAAGRMCALPLDLAVDGEPLGDCSAKLAEVTDYIDIVVCCAPKAELDEPGQIAPEAYRRAMEAYYLPVVSALHLSLPLLKGALYTPQFVAFGGDPDFTEPSQLHAHATSTAALACFLRCLPEQAQRLRLKGSYIEYCTRLINGGRSAPDGRSTRPHLDAEIKSIIAGIQKQRQIINLPEQYGWHRRFLRLMTR